MLSSTERSALETERELDLELGGALREGTANPNQGASWRPQTWRRAALPQRGLVSRLDTLFLRGDSVSRCSCFCELDVACRGMK